MDKQAEQQVETDAFTELATILLDHGEQHALSDLARLMEAIDSAVARAEAAEARLANDYYKRRTEELTTELQQLRVELAGVLETAIMRGESLGYTTADDDYRARLQELDPDAEILQDETRP